jgi:hypothetical protein
MTTTSSSPTLKVLMDHTNTVRKIALQLPLASNAATYGIPYFIGETNSFSVGSPTLSPETDLKLVELDRR